MVKDIEAIFNYHRFIKYGQVSSLIDILIKTKENKKASKILTTSNNEIFKTDLFFASFAAAYIRPAKA